jgi:protein-tyrosine-phosphatase
LPPAVSSAGTHPGSEVEPYVVEVLIEAGADPAGAFPEPPTDDAVRAADIPLAGLPST